MPSSFLAAMRGREVGKRAPMNAATTETTVYRVRSGLPWCGVAVLMVWVYVILYATKAIDWVLFSKVSDVRLRIEETGTIVFLLLMVCMSLAVAFTARIKVTVDTDGVVYRRWFRTVRLLWCDVTRMTYAPQGVDICLWTKRDYVRFGQYLSRGRELLGAVKERVSANAPRAEIVQAQPRFLPQWRKPERDADAKVGTGQP